MPQSGLFNPLTDQRAGRLDQHLDCVFPGIIQLRNGRLAFRQEPAGGDQNINQTGHGGWNTNPGNLEHLQSDAVSFFHQQAVHH